jgi:GAF domain-containing protein
MGFAAVARVTTDRWIAISVLDQIKFGLVPGGELKIDTTICHEIRQSGSGVVIDFVSEDAYFAKHHTPAMYGFQSYISMPVVRQDGSFFGTLCAIDPNPATLNTPEMIDMFKTYCSLISFYLDAADHAQLEEIKLLEDRTMKELEALLVTLKSTVAVAEGSGHDGTEPLAHKIAQYKKSPQFMATLRHTSDSIKAIINTIRSGHAASA